MTKRLFRDDGVDHRPRADDFGRAADSSTVPRIFAAD
jgi:hypothetical protein